MLRRFPPAAVMLLLLAFSSARAEVVFDGSLGGAAGPAQIGDGPRGRGTDYQIPAAAGRAEGSNLFHSFSFFGIESGRSATFSADGGAAFSNVVARVTGGQPSEIAGLLRSTISGADLYLLNPSGVVFAPGATLDLPAGLHLSSADSLHFADEKSFAATPRAGEVLSTAAPAAFGFLGPAAGSLVVESGAVLSVSAGSLALAGGNVDVGGTLRTVNGDLILAARDAIRVHDGGSINASGIFDARLSLSGENVSIVGPTSHVGLAVFSPSGHSGIDVSAGTLAVNDSAQLETLAAFGKTPPLEIRARVVDLSGGGVVDTDSHGYANGGDILVEASERVALSGRTADDQWAGLSTHTLGTGNAGSLTIRTPLLMLDEQGMITARTQGMGDAGRIELDVGSLRLAGGSRIEVDAGNLAHGRPGSLVVHASDSVSLLGVSDEGLDYLESTTMLSAVARYQGGGRIEVETPLLVLRQGAVLDARSEPNATGDASDIVLRVGRLDMELSHVVADSQGSGKAGTIEVQADEAVRLDVAHLDSRTYGSGAGGLVRVAAPVVTLSEYSQISTEAAQKLLYVPGGGASGTIELDVGRLTLESGGLLRADSRGTELGGRIVVRASEAVELHTDPGQSDHLSSIHATAMGDGPAGEIRIETPRLLVGEFTFIETSTTGASGTDGGDRVVRSGNAGDIHIVADEVVVDSHARIASDSRGLADNLGNAGAVDLEVGSLQILGSGEIRASTSTRGQGGAVIVHASRSVVANLGGGARSASIASTTDHSTGSGGSVWVEAPVVELHGGDGIGATSTGAGSAGAITVRAGSLLLTGGSEIASNALGSGPAGPVRVEARNALVVEGSGVSGPSGITTRSAGVAPGGSIEIAAGNVQLRDGATISASSTGTGNAGDVTIEVAGRFVATDASVSTSAPQADGGNITLRVGERAELHGSRIAADVTGGSGGNILAQAASLILDGSGITAEAGSGHGGAIRIVAEVVIRSQDSVVSAAAGASGISGSVRIETPERDVTRALDTMPVEFVDAVTLLHERCAARRGATASFVVADAAPSAVPSGDLLPVAVADHGDTNVERVALVLEPGLADEAPAWHIACGG